MKVVGKPTKGTVAQILCPHCGQLMDLRGFKEMGVLAVKAILECESCKRPSLVRELVERKVVVLAANGVQEIGPVAGVRCPVCKKPQDCTNIQEMKVLETGTTLTCDDCDGVYKVMSVGPQVIVMLQGVKK